MNRRLIALTPVLLIAGIVVQGLALVLAILLYVPCLIWPSILNGPYQWITRAGAHMAVRAVMGKRKNGARTKAETPV